MKVEKDAKGKVKITASKQNEEIKKLKAEVGKLKKLK